MESIVGPCITTILSKVNLIPEETILDAIKNFNFRNMLILHLMILLQIQAISKFVVVFPWISNIYKIWNKSG
jgi:mannose/fructose/N-acetylgalactosamine-specific phosphotransferase system component IIC